MKKVKSTLPSFVKCFKDNSSALKAMTILVSAKESGYTNRKVLDLPFFKNLFNESYLNSCSELQLEWRLKNMARDLKKVPYDDLENSWHEFKKYFEGTRRKSLNEEKTTIFV